ncbi:MAG: hydrogenase maturation nickel metallochaperone HypA [Terriglobales bacterium]|jgi:hydrogenase nickel incorporation protein HypA/HybF
MHELSIAMSIVEMAEEEAARQGGHVSAVHLKLGALSGVVKEALLSSYEMACEGTCLAGSHLIVEEIPIVMFCAPCNAQRAISSAQWFCCPECGSPSSDIVQGKELEVVALEILGEDVDDALPSRAVSEIAPCEMVGQKMIDLESRK